MIGDLYINDKDAWLTWGVFLEDNSESKLLLPANPKAYASNNLRNQAGKQVFVSNPQPDERDVLLVFCISAKSKADYLTKYNAFLAEIYNGWINFKVTSLKTTYRFTVSSFQDLSYFDRLGKLSVRFNEPNPKDRISL